MGNRLTFGWVRHFIEARFPDPEPEIPCVRAYRAVASVLLSAVVLETVEPTKLQQFTGYHAAFIASVAWNMRNNKLWTPTTYDTSCWQSASGQMDDRLFLEDVDVALGTAWCPDAEFPNDAIDTSQVYRDLLRWES
jgi:hypothetical protein